MRTPEALSLLSVTAESVTDDQRRAFQKDGFFVVPDALSSIQCNEIANEIDRLVALEAEAAGIIIDPEPGTSQLSDLFNKSAVFDCCLEIAPAVQTASELLGEIKLHGVNMREPLKGMGLQPLHSDVAKRHPTDWQLTNTLVFIDPLTEQNGPTRLVPGSHQWPHLNVPDLNLIDPEENLNDGGWLEPGGGYRPYTGTTGATERLPEDPLAPYPGEVLVTGAAGTAVIINAHIWHGGTTNKTGDRRRMLHLSYTPRDLPQQFIQRDHVTSEMCQRVGAAHRFLLDIEGYAELH